MRFPEADPVFLPSHAMRRLLSLILATAVLGAATAGRAESAQPLTGAQVTYRDLADRGLKNAQRLWGDSRRRWYRDRLNDRDRYPLATIWSIVPLWESMNALAIADHSHAHV